MTKLWKGRTAGETSAIADAFNSSIAFDSRMATEDIGGSIAHATMLAAQGIISKEEGDALTSGLASILTDLAAGTLSIDYGAEDIHMFVEEELTKRIGSVGKKLHTARSRNDQVALDMRLYLRKEMVAIADLIKEFLNAIITQAEKEKDTIMPGYTHLQIAQPVTFGHHLMAYAFMLLRDKERLADATKRMDVSPIGSCALAGTTYPTDREMEANILSFHAVSQNSMDSVSDRDFIIEIVSDLSILMMHLSRLAEEIVIWSSWEFGFIELSDAYTTGSSIMPQKKNPDMAELIRGKTGRVYGSLITLLTMMKGLPLAYNKDMQEDKEALFDALDTCEHSLVIFTEMIATMKSKPENMLAAAQKGFINATDLADYLVGKGMAFRDAYKVSGEIVSDCIEKGFILETYPISLYKEKADCIEEDVYDTVDLKNCVMRRCSLGGTGKGSVEKQIAIVKEKL
ncbi:MAG: argininosuccinate lyase [Firmicutes bacterium]|nr:argininosuccinate lyase [Bacillota bacterium]